MESVYVKDKYFGLIQAQRNCCLLMEEIRKFGIFQIAAVKLENGGCINFITCPFLLAYTRKYMATN